MWIVRGQNFRQGLFLQMSCWTHTHIHGALRDKGQTCTFAASHYWCLSATNTLNNRMENIVGITSAPCMWVHFALIRSCLLCKWLHWGCFRCWGAGCWMNSGLGWAERKNEIRWNSGRKETILGAAVPLRQKGQTSQNHGVLSQTLISIFACVSSKSIKHTTSFSGCSLVIFIFTIDLAF